MPRKRRPDDWREKCFEAYEEGGRGIGRMLAYYPEREPDVWAWIGGLKIWPRYYLIHFVTYWRKENPKEAHALWKRRWRKKGRKAQQDKEIKDALERTRKKFGG